MNELNLTSKIEKRGHLSKSERKTAGASTGKASEAYPADKVTLSQSAQGSAETIKEDSSANSEIRHDIVNKYRNFLGNGTYVVKADEIADKIIQKIRESKNHHLI